MERTITIDGTGRLVIPMEVRKKLQLHAGSRLTVTTEGGRVVLQPIETGEAMVERLGLLFITGRVQGEWPDHRDLREQRLDHLAGDLE